MHGRASLVRSAVILFSFVSVFKPRPSFHNDTVRWPLAPARLAYSIAENLVMKSSRRRRKIERTISATTTSQHQCERDRRGVETATSLD
ncbi:hypothetical protein C2E23DRAFT_850829 [Lenzites betulinus]|nr:hypothetical protein C2E23DRAFT_850829 [Lenzites betulinus]